MSPEQRAALVRNALAEAGYPEGAGYVFVEGGAVLMPAGGVPAEVWWRARTLGALAAGESPPCWPCLHDAWMQPEWTDCTHYVWDGAPPVVRA